MTFNIALQRAQHISLENQCDQFVNFIAERVVDGDTGMVEGYFVASDWYDSDSTVAHYRDGNRVED